MTSTIGSPALARSARSSPSSSRLTGSDRLWALAFATPYVLVFFAFAIYPICDPPDRIRPMAWQRSSQLSLGAPQHAHLPAGGGELETAPGTGKGWWTKTLLLISSCPGPCSPSPDRPPWLDNANLALGSAIDGCPCTIILLAGRMPIPTELYAARKVDGASSLGPLPAHRPSHAGEPLSRLGAV